MPRTFQEIFLALEERLEQAKQGALPIGHAMELRRRERRQAMGCPSDEEICGFVDGELKAYGTRRWAEVGWHVHRCQLCQQDVEALAEALDLGLHTMSATLMFVRQRLLRFAVPVAGVAAVFVLIVLGMQTIPKSLPERATDSHFNQDTEPLNQAPALVPRQEMLPPQERPLLEAPSDHHDNASTMKVSMPSYTDISASPGVRVAICSETEQPTCGEGMVLMSTMKAACKVMGDENSCFAKNATGGCAICQVTK